MDACESMVSVVVLPDNTAACAAIGGDDSQQRCQSFGLQAS